LSGYVCYNFGSYVSSPLPEIEIHDGHVANGLLDDPRLFVSLKGRDNNSGSFGRRERGWVLGRRRGRFLEVGGDRGLDVSQGQDLGILYNLFLKGGRGSGEALCRILYMRSAIAVALMRWVLVLFEGWIRK
jgi:hypothetical protein